MAIDKTIQANNKWKRNQRRKKKLAGRENEDNFHAWKRKQRNDEKHHRHMNGENRRGFTQDAL